MVPSSKVIVMLALGFPRASGDGPAPVKASVPIMEFPPRERGWSLVAMGRLMTWFVSPARAGMVPAP